MTTLKEESISGFRYFSVPALATHPIDIKIFPKQSSASHKELLITPEDILSLSSGTSCKYLKQVHSTTVRAAESVRSPLEEGDALYTHTTGVTLLIKHADCQATIFYDTVNHVIANVHCGWRGLVSGIYTVTLNSLKERFSSKPKDMVVFIGPSLGITASEFLSYKRIFPKYFQEFMTPGSLFDLKAIARHQMQNLGIPEKQIYTSDICTHDSLDFFSYRRNCRANLPVIKNNRPQSPYRGNWTAVTLNHRSI